MQLNDRHIAVIGLGKTGLSVIDFLLEQGARVHAMDTRSSLQVHLNADIPVSCGPLQEDVLSKMDMLVVSPGVAVSTPAIQHASKAGVEVLGDIELFARFNRLPVIAITGSNGKSTVTMLVRDMLQEAGKKVLMGGNIGVPALSLLNQPGDVVVLELSSFQLETTSSLTPIAATILNISDDHMDRYVDLAAYQNAKHRVYHGATHCICPRDDASAQVKNYPEELSFGLSDSNQGFSYEQGSGTICYGGQPWLAMAECQVAGLHNALNIQAAAALAMCVIDDNDAFKQAARTFTGLPHRCQLVSGNQPVRWINDSKATNVGATLAAIAGIRPETSGKLILIAGGDGKGADLTELQPALQQLDGLITLGRDGPQIAALRADSIQVTTMAEAVRRAASMTHSGDVVLLSPACASLDMYNNYMQRGDDFAREVSAL